MEIVKKELSTIIKQYGMGSAILGALYSGSVWREKKPVWDSTRCFKCGICYLSCPDAAIMQIDEGYYDMNPELCKGCGICAAECPNEAITMTPEKA